MRWCVPLMAAVAFLLLPRLAQAQENDGTTSATVPTRPAILANRWQEDWSVLADPRVPREPFDDLKYIPLSLYDPKTYLSLGADFRERFEGNDGENFGTTPHSKNDYLISRTEAYADLHIADQVQIFTQILERLCALENDHRAARSGRSRRRAGLRNGDRAGRRRHAAAAIWPAANEFRLPALRVRPRRT